jgi:hypothetical protein
MARLAHKPQKQSRTLVAGHRKANGIAVAFYGQARTFRGVSQIAKFVKFLLRRLSTFVTWSGAMTVPPAS